MLSESEIHISLCTKSQCIKKRWEKQKNSPAIDNASSKWDDDLFITKKQGSAEHLLEHFMNAQRAQVDVGEAGPPKQSTYSPEGLAK